MKLNKLKSLSPKNNRTVITYSVFFLSLLFFITTSFLIAQEPFAGTRSLVLLKKGTEIRTAHNFIEVTGGHILHLFPPRLLIGYLTEKSSFELKSSGVVDTILNQFADFSMFGELSQTEKFGIQQWNDLFINTVQINETYAPYTPAIVQNDEPTFVDHLPNATHQHSMTGPVSVAVIFVESDGTIDKNKESWLDESKNEMFKNISDGLEWWAFTGGHRADLSWTFDIQTCYTGYEPIQRTKSESPLWINECMKQLGFAIGSDLERSEAFSNALKQKNLTDHAFIIFAVSSRNDSDGYFAGQTGAAWAYVGGSSIVIPEKCSNWSYNKLWKVAAHEIGHIFMATDEYNNESNSVNAVASNVNDATLLQPPAADLCIMKTNDPVLCEKTLKQIGWIDQNKDGIFDFDKAASSNLFHIKERKMESNSISKNKLLFYENFSRKNDWYEDKNNYVSNGTYQMYDSTYGSSSWLERSYDDFVASVKTQWIQGSLSSGYGLMVRAKTATDGYIFFINRYGQFAFGKYVNANWKYLIPWTDSEAILKNAENVLNISCIGNRFTLTINDQEVATVKDDTFIYGYIGLTVLPQIQASFDDLVVFSP